MQKRTEFSGQLNWIPHEKYGERCSKPGVVEKDE
jgi:hypothetical protein